MRLLAIETSCDDTGVALMEDGRVVSQALSSQVDIHALFGGVVPELAARKHLEALYPLTLKVLEEGGVSLDDLDCIGVTVRPGLVPSLLVGLSFAKALAFGKGLPLVGVDHLEAHVFSIFLEREVAFPFVGLVVSGGHTSLFLVEDYGHMALIGQTRDDAAGEAFDKVAKLLDLAIPGDR
jgi:N6-L-threonylcarbamoyladenine synthase